MFTLTSNPVSLKSETMNVVIQEGRGVGVGWAMGWVTLKHACHLKMPGVAVGPSLGILWPLKAPSVSPGPQLCLLSPSLSPRRREGYPFHRGDWDQGGGGCTGT